MAIEGINSSSMSYRTATSGNEKRVASDTAKENITVSEETARVNYDAMRANTADDQSAVGDAEDSKASVDAIKKAVEEINKTCNNNTVQFGVHEKTNRMTIKILDKDTRKVVKEFPAEKSLDLIAKAMEMAGILIDEKR